MPLRRNSLTLRLTGTLLVALALLLAVTGLVQIRLQSRYAAACARINGLSLSETLSSALHTQMLANDRKGLHAAVHLVTERSPNLRIRIFNKEGGIVFSSSPHEVGTRVDPRSEACYGCHAADRPIERLPPGERTRHFEVDGVPALGIIKPIENEPACSRAACHAHPPERRLLGVLDVTFSLTQVELARRQTALLMVATLAGVMLLTVAVVVTVVRRAVRRPIRALASTLDQLGTGDYSARHEQAGIAEFGQLGEAVNRMARDLERANAKLVEWAQTLERRVEEKTAELRRAQDQMLRVERMASLGKLAAVVAHEINNPMASVVTYSKLLLRRFGQKKELSPEWQEQVQVLEAIASESTRCGEIVSRLLLFARRTDSQLVPTDANAVVEKAVFLIKHKLDLAQVRLALELGEELPRIVCDPSQLEQALLALCINAIEAMAEGGTLTLKSGRGADGSVRVEVADTGCGMSEEVRAHSFEPFFTTKGEGEGKGLGLGLAVVYGIMQRNGGSIEVASEVGRGTTFTLSFPPGPEAAAPASSEE
jgi:two-component system NtrC family sensor kinase